VLGRAGSETGPPRGAGNADAPASVYAPNYLLDRTIGAVLTFVGTRMAWRQWRNRMNRRVRIREALASGGW